jgi:hypothetical protein
VRVQLGQEARLAAVIFIEGQPVQVQAVAGGAVQLLQGDAPLGTIDDLVGNGRLAAALAVVAPRFGQKQVAIDQGLVAAAADAEVDGDDTVFFLAHSPAPLPLDAGGLVSLLDLTGFVDEADDAEVGGGQGPQPLGNLLLELIAQARLVPDVIAQKVLQGADGGAGGPGNGLDRLARQVGKQAPAIGVQMLTRAVVQEAPLERT